MADRGSGGMISADTQRQWLKQHMLQADMAPVGQPDWLINARAVANREAFELPALNRKQEAWRYTSIEKLLERQFEQVTNSPDVTADELQRRVQQYEVAELNAYQVTILNGQFAAQLSNIDTLPEGVSIQSLSEVMVTDPDLLEPWFGSIARQSQHVFSALNTALVNDGIFLRINAGVKLDRPIELLYVVSERESSQLIQPRNLIVIEDNANATIVERYLGENNCEYFHNHLAEITLGVGAHVQHYRIQHESRNAYHLSSVFLSQQAHSRYLGTCLSFGATWSRMEYHTAFKQSNAECDLNGLSLIGGDQLSDYHINVCHNEPACKSRERFKSVLYGRGRAVFDGYILVEKQAQKTEAQMTNDNLLLTRDAEVDTKPRLEIYADDVICSHGTTVGELDPNHIFYLRSRGNDETTAKRLLCLGFANDIIDSIRLQALKTYAVNLLSGFLNDRNFSEV